MGTAIIKILVIELCQQREIDEYTKCILVDMSNKVLEHIAEKYERVKEGVKSVMGGKVLDYEAKMIFHKGWEEGKEEGIFLGRMEAYMEFIRKGLITVKQAAEELHMEEDKLKERM